MNRLVRFLVFMSAAILSACVTPQLKMTPEDAAKRGLSDVVLAVPSEVIRAQFLPSTGGGSAAIPLGIVGIFIGSAIDGAINSSRSKDAEVGISQFQDVLKGYKFSDKIKATIASRLGKADPQRVNPLQAKLDILTVGLDSGGQTEFNLMPGARHKLFAQTKAGSIIIFGMEHSMTPGRDFLQITAVAMVIKRGESEDSFMHRWMYIESKAPAAGEGTSDQRWLAKDGAELIKALDEARHEIVEKMVADLFLEPANEPKK
jgi:hypothetical protein